MVDIEIQPRKSKVLSISKKNIHHYTNKPHSHKLKHVNEAKYIGVTPYSSMYLTLLKKFDFVSLKYISILHGGGNPDNIKNAERLRI